MITKHKQAKGMIHTFYISYENAFMTISLQFLYKNASKFCFLFTRNTCFFKNYDFKKHKAQNAKNKAEIMKQTMKFSFLNNVLSKNKTCKLQLMQL